MTKNIRCEGYRRSAETFNLGPARWEHCESDATVLITVLLKTTQDGDVKHFPACQDCWQEAIQNEIPIHEVKPIQLCIAQP